LTRKKKGERASHLPGKIRCGFPHAGVMIAKGAAGGKKGRGKKFPMGEGRVTLGGEDNVFTRQYE